MITIFSFDKAPTERVTNRESLANQLDAQVFIGGNNTCTNFVNLLKLAKGKDLLLIEDDVQLCNDFTPILDDVLSQYPDTVINFHYNEKTSTTTDYHPATKYAYNQCVYFPKRIVNKLIPPCTAFIKMYPYYVNKGDYAIQIKYGLMKCNEYFLAYEPKLVKHLNFTSTLGDRPVITQNFIDNGVSDE